MQRRWAILPALIVFLASACTVDDLVSEGRPCSDALPCGPGSTCDPVTRACSKSVGPDCPEGRQRCGETCVDLSSDRDHCGACGRVCEDDGDADTCRAGSCVCGAAADPCVAGLDCVEGACRCVTGGRCSGCCDGDRCTAPGSQQSVDRCGADGAPCSSCRDDLTCTTDQCLAGACSNPLEQATCLIQATCYQDLAVNPANPCKRCERQAPYAWTWYLAQGCVLTLAGSGTRQLLNGPTEAAGFSVPHGVAADTSTSTIYVGDSDNYAIRKIAGGQVTTVAGTGKLGYVDGPAKSAKFNYPMGVAVDSAGTLFVADFSNHVIRRIAGGQVTTFAGTGKAGFQDGPAAAAQFKNPADVEVDAAGAVYVADAGNYLIRKIAGGQVTTVAGGGYGYQDGPAAGAQFTSLRGLWVSQSGDELYVADTFNYVIRRIAGGQVTTVAGVAGSLGYKDGPAAGALFAQPWDVVKDSAGALYVTDVTNHRIRRIASGVVTTAAGTGSSTYSDGPGDSAAFQEPTGLAERNGVIYIADSENCRIRHFRP